MTSSSVRVVGLRCEYGVNPMGVDDREPRLSWRIESGERGQRQTACRIIVATSLEKLIEGEADLWDSGEVTTDQSIHVPYAGQPLTSNLRCYWRVRVRDMSSRLSDWSETAEWTMGLLEESDWKARWIGLDEPPQGVFADGEEMLANSHWVWAPEGTPTLAAPSRQRYFRADFDLPHNRLYESATLYVAHNNEHAVWINGHKCEAIAHGSQADRFDVAQSLVPGRNVLAISAENPGGAGRPAGLAGLLRIELDGSAPLIVRTDGTWRASTEETPDWQKPGTPVDNWGFVQALGAFATLAGVADTRALEKRRLPARMLRREVRLRSDIRRATVYVCGLGYNELHINGHRIGDNVLDPGLTDYAKRVLYTTYDVTGDVREGDNALGVILGNGRFFGPRVFVPFTTTTYGYPKLLLQMIVEYAEGSAETIVSDPSWRITDEGPIRANNDYDGEVYDARMEQAGWSLPGFRDDNWLAAQEVEAPGGKLVSQTTDPIRVTETLSPVGITEPSAGVHVIDFGQNIVGWVRLKVRGDRGTVVRLRHSERLDGRGTIETSNIRSADAEDVYVLAGSGDETYEPRFTYHGFRYVELQGYPGPLDASAITACVVHSSVRKTGSFSCSNKLLNCIHDAAVWGMRGNLRSIPTDCPQRDERQGWLGDIANVSKSESFEFEVARFYAKWLSDIRDAQLDNGALPDVAPPYWRFVTGNVTWPIAYVVIVHWFHEQYGDLRLVRNHYASMCRWVDQLTGMLDEGTLRCDVYGDWCMPPESPELIHAKDPSRHTNGELLATAHYYHALRLLTRSAGLLGRKEDEARFQALAAHVKSAFNKRFLNERTSAYDNGTQTSSILPMAFSLVPEGCEADVMTQLAERIEVGDGGRVGTGLVGGQWLMRVLSRGGRIDLAYRLATRTEYPSWGYMMENGATTLWELWNGDTADPAMNSHNHIMLLGDLGIWFYEILAGIKSDPELPGFRHVIMQPQPVGDLRYVKAAYDSLHGRIESEWRIKEESFRWRIVIPANTTATAHVPTDDPAAVTETGCMAQIADGIEFRGGGDGVAIYELSAGTYEFSAPYSPSTSRGVPQHT